MDDAAFWNQSSQSSAIKHQSKKRHQSPDSNNGNKKINEKKKNQHQTSPNGTKCDAIDGSPRNEYSSITHLFIYLFNGANKQT